MTVLHHLKNANFCGKKTTKNNKMFLNTEL